jgi:hypothetical protein
MVLAFFIGAFLFLLTMGQHRTWHTNGDYRDGYDRKIYLGSGFGWPGGKITRKEYLRRSSLLLGVLRLGTG